MSGLLSMLVDLQTLSGWPAAPPVSVVSMLVLLVGLPLVATLVIMGLVAAGSRNVPVPYDIGPRPGTDVAKHH